MIAALQLKTKEVNTFATPHQSFGCNNRACFIMLTEKSTNGLRYKLGMGLDEVFGISNDLSSKLLKSIYCCDLDMIRDYAFSKSIKTQAEGSDKSVGIITYFNAWKVSSNGRLKMIRVMRESFVIDIVDDNGTITQAYICFFTDISDSLPYSPLTSIAVDTKSREELEAFTNKAIRQTSWKVLEHLGLNKKEEAEFLYLCAHSQKQSMSNFNKTKDGVKYLTKRYRDLVSHLFIEGYTFDAIKMYLRLCEIF